MSDETTTTANESDLRERVLDLAKHGEAGDLLDIWNDVCANPPSDQEFYSQLLRARATTYDAEAMHSYFAQLTGELVKREDWQLILRIVDAAAAKWPDSDELRSAVVLALQAKYEDHPNIQEMINFSRLEENAPIDQGLKRFRALLKVSPGRAYQHATWGVGVVRELDLTQGKVTLDFPNEKGRVLTLAGVRDFVKYLPPSHFLAQRATDPAKLATMAEENPVSVIRLALESHGGRLKQSELKQLLIGGVLPESKWNSWWTRARGELRMDPLIDFDSKGGAHAELALRSKPKTFEEEVQDLFLGPEADLAGRIAAVKNLQDAQSRPGADAPDPELLARMLKTLEADFQSSSRSLSSTDRLQFALLAEDLRTVARRSDAAPGIPDPGQLLEDFDGSYDELAKVEHPDHAARALRLLMERDGERGFELAARLFPKAPSRLAQVIWKALDPEHHKDLVVPAVQRLFEAPLDNPQTYLWSVKQMIDGNWKHLNDYFPASWLAVELLEGMDNWEKLMDRPSVDKTTQAAAKLLLSRVKSMFEQNHFRLLCDAAEQMELEQVRRLRRMVQSHAALPEAYRAAAERQLVLTRRELLEDKGGAAAAASPGLAPSTQADAIHHCTPRAREQKLNELNELNTVKIPANSREIEKARSEGDLKENAGYIYAKEQQKLLMQQSLQLQQALQTARVFDRSKVTTDTISFGTAFEATNLKKGTVEKYTVLGRFETDPDKNIVSYQSPFMSQFIGKRTGEEFTVKHPDGGETPYRIEAITDALAGGEWDSQEEAPQA